MENAIQYLIYMHAGFGGIALLAGLGAIIAKKGSVIHRKSGIVFYYSMLMSGITAMVIALLPNHKSPFLFAIGIFSLYFVLTGYRALRFKRRNVNLNLDKVISSTMFLTAVLMLALPVIIAGKINIILSVFAVVGLIFSIRDFQLYKNPIRLRKGYLKLHLGKMLGGYISATTAFVVVNNFFPNFYGWFIPGIIGAAFIAYWTRRVDGKFKVK